MGRGIGNNPLAYRIRLIPWSTLDWARSASKLKAHCRQQGPSCVPVDLSVAGLLLQMEHGYAPALSSSISNANGNVAMVSSADLCKDVAVEPISSVTGVTDEILLLGGVNQRENPRALTTRITGRLSEQSREGVTGRVPGSSRSAGGAKETANASTTAATEMQQEPRSSMPYMVSIALRRDPSQCRASLHSRNGRPHSATVGRAVGLDADRALPPTFANCFVLAKRKPRSIWTGVGKAVYSPPATTVIGQP